MGQDVAAAKERTIKKGQRIKCKGNTNSGWVHHSTVDHVLYHDLFVCLFIITISISWQHAIVTELNVISLFILEQKC